MRNLVAILIVVFCCALCRAQDPNTTIEQNSTLGNVLPWSETTTGDFQYHGEGYLIDHLRNHPMLGDELEKLHEWLHQKIERLRPRHANGGSAATVFFEGTDAQFKAWADRQSIESAGWIVVRLPAQSRLVSVVAIGKTHFSHAGFLTISQLQKFVNQVENRRIKPLKNAKARYVAKLTMYTRSPCVWCERWMATEYPKALADGVEITFVTDPNGTVPRFEICDEGGQCRQFTGFVAWQNMRGL